MSSGKSPTPTLGLGPLLKRGLRKKCPHCGTGEVLDGQNRLRVRCSTCGYEFERRGGDLFFFLYVGAGVITFFFIVVMYTFRVWSYGWAVRLPYLLLGIGTMIGLMSRRMGVAVALDYLSRVLFEDREAWEPREAGEIGAVDERGAKAEAGEAGEQPRARANRPGSP